MTVKSGDKGDAVMRSKLNMIIAAREQDEGRRITQIEIAHATGISPHTISRWMEPTPFKRIEADIVEPLLRYLDCKLDDLVEVVRINEANAT